MFLIETWNHYEAGAAQCLNCEKLAGGLNFSTVRV